VAINCIQTRYRLRSDALTVDSASVTWFAAENTTFFPGIGNKFRLRTEVQNTGTTSTGATTWNLFVSRNSGTYTQVTTSSSFVQSADASSDADNTSLTTRRLTADAGTFVTGQYDESGATGSITLTASSVTEFEFGLILVGGSNGDTLDFRVQRGSTALNTYTVTPRITLAIVSPSPNAYAAASPVQDTAPTFALVVTKSMPIFAQGPRWRNIISRWRR